MLYCVYIHTNKINGKKYVGITSQTPFRRWKNGEGYKGCSYFYNAIKKYGWDNFYHDIVEVDLSKDEACALEQEYISKMKTNREEYGYNLLSGGTAGKHSEKTKEKLSRMFTGKVVSNETKKKLKEAAKKRGGHPQSKQSREKMSRAMLGHEVSEATRVKLREAASIAVVCVETGEVFQSMDAAAKNIGLAKCSISAVIHGRNKTAGGYHWELATKQQLNVERLSR